MPKGLLAPLCQAPLSLGTALVGPPTSAVAGGAKRAVSTTATHAAGVVTSAVGQLSGRSPSRRVRVYGPRVHVTLSRPHGDAESLAAALESALEAHPDVAWARVNWPTSRVVVEVSSAERAVEELVEIVDKVEALQAVDSGSTAEDSATDGASRDDVGSGLSAAPRVDTAREEASRQHLGLMLLLDAAGLAVTAVETVFRRAPLPAEVSGVVGLVESLPRLRGWVTGVVPASASWPLPVVEALARALGPGWSGLVVDLAQRTCQLQEAQARSRAWDRAEPTLTGAAERAAASALTAERPRPLPDGPVERHQNRASVGALTAPVVAGMLTRSARRGLAAALAASPKAAVAGREVFAARLGTVLSRREAVVVHPEALRRLDRVDTVLLDADAMLGSRYAIRDVRPISGGRDDALAHAYALFDPEDVTSVHRGAGWLLGPPDKVRADDRTSPPERLPKHGMGSVVLLLAEGGHPRAEVTIAPEPVSECHALVVAARQAGQRLLIAGEEREYLPVTGQGAVPGGRDLTQSVHALQRDGHGVLLVSRDGAALAQADCGVGVPTRSGAPAWGAHVLTSDLTLAATLIHAAGAARAVSRQGVTLALSGSGLASILALTGPPGGTSRQALTAVSGAASLSMLNGILQARSAVRRPLAPPLPTTPWHAMPVAAVLGAFGSGPNGLSEVDVLERRARNSVPAADPPGLGRAFLDELANPMTPVLAAGAAGSAVVGSPVDAVLVAGVMGAAAAVGGVQRRATERLIARLSPRSTTQVTVRRDGRESSTTSDALVTGDVVVLRWGDVVPADCRIIDAEGLECDESTLTGESLPVAKSAVPAAAATVAERRSMVYEGTTVAAGTGTAVVVAIGAESETGRAMAAAAEAAPSSGVDRRLASLTRATTPMALGAALGVVASGLVRGTGLRQVLSEGIGLAVAAVPEGLPLLVSAAQLAASRRLAKRGVVVRNPRTIEALGRVDTLCFDKTGTLTEGEISLARVGDARHDAPVDQLDESLRHVLATGLRATPDPSGESHTHVTDRAIAEGAASVGVGRNTPADRWHELDTLHFETSRGFHAATGRTDGVVLLNVKGAPETVLPLCTRVRSGGGDTPMSADESRRIQAHVEALAHTGHRVLVVAERVRRADSNGLVDDDVSDLTFVGVLGLADTIRDTAAAAVAGLRKAGVQIVMLTGDHPSTAGAIASRVGENGDDHRVITGAEIDALDDDALDAVLPEVDVVARCTPAHKVRVVRAFRRLGRTVAMAGDGANDAPAIRLADVGLALGTNGNDAARAAADLVVADDKLEPIISALVEGRAMWASVRDALGILVGGNLGEIGYTLAGSLVSGRSPLSARQMLLVNMLTDLVPALAIAVRAPSLRSAESLLDEGPESSLAGSLTRSITRRAAVTGSGAGTAWMLARATGPAVRARTVGLVALVATQLAQTVVAGRHDRVVVLSAVGSAALLAAVVQTPGLGAFFGCVPLDPLAWAIALGSAAAATIGGRALPDMSSTRTV